MHGGCQPQHVTLPRWCLRQWELGVTTGTSRWMTCTCRMEPAPSQVRAHPTGAPWIRWGGWDILWGHVSSGDGDRPVPALSLAWPEAGGGVSHPSAPSPTRYHRLSHSPSFLPASCDFEQDTCGWSSPSDPRLHSLAWGWKSGITLAKYPSPEQDHTLGTRNGRKHPSLPRHPGMARARKRGWGWMGSAQSIL